MIESIDSVCINREYYAVYINGRLAIVTGSLTSDDLLKALKEHGVRVEQYHDVEYVGSGYQRPPETFSELTEAVVGRNKQKLLEQIERLQQQISDLQMKMGEGSFGKAK